jgi:hypothetical protein
MVRINRFGVTGRAWRWRRVAAAGAAGLLAAGLVAAAAGPAAAAPSPSALAFSPSATLTATAKKATATDSLTGEGTVTKTTPTLTTSPGMCVVPEGSPPFPCDAEDSASLAGVTRPSSGVIAGTLNFTLYGPSATPHCSGKPVFPPQSEVVELSSNGGYFVAVPVSGAGTYWWVVSYTGDANNKPVTSHCGAESTTA